MDKHNFKKQFGQNFISDINLLTKIVSLAEVTKADTLVEIGAGSGNLTKALAETEQPVIAYEIDRDLKSVLESKLPNNVKIIIDDFLSRDIEEDLSKINKIKVIANLPYYITTPIMFKLLESKLPIDTIIIMVQKEVGERFAAKPNTKQYNALSIILQTNFDITLPMNVNRKLFYPVPKVDSVVVKLKRKDQTNIENEAFFKQLVKDAFRQKRKQLKNNLQNYDWNEIIFFLSKLGYNEKVRAENITVEDFIKVANHLV